MKGRIVGIEILRFLSSVAVLVWHYQHFYFDPHAGTINVVRSAEPLYGLLAPFYNYGWLGVNFFWSISGYIFFHQYLNRIYGARVSGRNFFVLRFSRLYPLHFVTLLAVLVLQIAYVRENGIFFIYQHNGVGDFIAHLFFASGWATSTGDSFNGPAWSVSTEVLVYIAFFLLARYVRLTLAKSALIVVISAAVGIVMIRHQIKDNLSNIVFCFFYFFLGGIVHLVYSRFKDLLARYRVPAVGLCGAVCVAVVVFCIEVGFTKYLIATALAPVFIAMLQLIDDWLPQKLTRYVVVLGNMTYSSYLIHFPLQLATVLALRHWSIDSASFARQPLFLAIYLVVIFCLAFCVYEYFEAPAQSFLRRRMLSRTGSASRAP